MLWKVFLTFEVKSCIWFISYVTIQIKATEQRALKFLGSTVKDDLVLR